MESTAWSVDDIVAFVGGRMVFARDRDVREVDVPAWLRQRASVGGRWEDQVSLVHLNDRPRTIRAWWHAVATPGEPVDVEFRSSRDGERWTRVHAQYLNLLDHPDVGAVLLIHEDVGPTDAPDDEADGAHDTTSTTADYEAPTWIVQYLDALGAVIGTDGNVEEVFGRPAAELAGRNVLDVLHPDDHDAAIAMWLEVMSAPQTTRTIRQRVVRPDGSTVWIESTVMNQLEQTGAVVAVSHDVSARRDQEAALRARERELRTLAESVPVAVFRATADGTITYANSRWYELTAPYGPIASLTQLVRWPPPATNHFDVRAPDGRTLRVRARTVRAGGDVLGTLDDVTAEIEHTAELRRRAERDALTGLVNRAGLEARLADANSDNGCDTVLVFVDLDGFKSVNDTWGHHAGDAVLGHVAGRLRSAVRPSDVVARYGGDEFVLLCDDVAPGEEATILARIHHVLTEPVVAGDAVWHAAASVGVVRPAPGETAESALRRADHEMYERKRARR
jgi:diguanylate cyclase (GGDEF)-like protein/PAS domain S-box-containing protein